MKFQYEFWSRIDDYRKSPQNLNDNSVGMDEFGARAFTMAAQKLDVYIIVRGINPGSLRYIHKKGRFQPKLQDCKPKTAQHTDVQGLVVNPFANPRFFSTKTNGAKKEYQKFLTGIIKNAMSKMGGSEKKNYCDFIPKGKSKKDGSILNHLYEEGHSKYGMVTTGRFKGVLKYRKYKGAKMKLVCGDWDLKDVFKNPGDHLMPVVESNPHTPELYHTRAPEVQAVEEVVNGEYGSEVINHGDEVNFKDHVEDELFVFVPKPALLSLFIGHDPGSTRSIPGITGSITATDPVVANNRRMIRSGIGDWRHYLEKEVDLLTDNCIRIEGLHNIQRFYDLIGRDLTNGFRFPI